MSPGSQHDRLNVTGAAGLDGTLDLELVGGFTPVVGDRFTVMTFGSRSGTFPIVQGNILGGGLTLTPVYSATDLVLLTVAGGEKTWGVDASGNSSVGGNWIGGVPPGGVGDAAAFTTIITAPRTVTIDVPTTVGKLRFDDNNNYSLIGPARLTLQATGAAHAEIVVNNTHGNGAHTIAAPIRLASDLDIVQGSFGTFTLAGALNNPDGRAIDKSGPGALTLSGAQAHGGGAELVVREGTVNLHVNSGAPSAGPPATANLRLSVLGGELAIGADQDVAALDVDESAARRRDQLRHRRGAQSPHLRRRDGRRRRRVAADHRRGVGRHHHRIQRRHLGRLRHRHLRPSATRSSTAWASCWKKTSPEGSTWASVR